MTKPREYSDHLTQEERTARAETQFKRKAEQRSDASKAMQEYRNTEQAARDRTAKLRAERIARNNGD